MAAERVTVEQVSDSTTLWNVAAITLTNKYKRVSISDFIKEKEWRAADVTSMGSKNIVEINYNEKETDSPSNGPVI